MVARQQEMARLSRSRKRPSGCDFPVVMPTRSARVNGTVALRAFPYPYRAALTICSDIDDTRDVGEFLEIQRFLNTKQTTSMGEGVGLEIGNSFYFYPNRNEFSYFGPEESARRCLVDLMHAGYVDCLHSYGYGPITRDQVLRALEELDKNDCHLDVWVNHSGASGNFCRKFQRNFGGPCDGDDPACLAYHADVTLLHGFRFACVGAMSRRVGQSSRNDAIMRSIVDARHPLWTTASLLKALRKEILGAWGDERYALASSNQLIGPLMLGDGQRLYEFQRYCRHPQGVSRGATLRGLAYAISEAVLECLKALEGYTIVYTHLGMNDDTDAAVAPKLRQRCEIWNGSIARVTFWSPPPPDC